LFFIFIGKKKRVGSTVKAGEIALSAMKDKGKEKSTRKVKLVPTRLFPERKKGRKEDDRVLP